MKLQLDDGAIQVKSCAGGVSILTIEGLDELAPECAIVTLDRKQVIELIAMLLVNTCPAPTSEEIDEAVVKLVFNNLGQD